MGQDVLLSGLGWDILLGEEVFFLLIRRGRGVFSLTFTYIIKYSGSKPLFILF